MIRESATPGDASLAGRVPPYSDEAEQGVLGSILLDAARVMDICIEKQIIPESFHVPRHRAVYEALLEMSSAGMAIDILTVTEHLRKKGSLDDVGGAVALDRLMDSTPTPAHAEYYIDIVRQKHILRSIIDCAREAEGDCFSSQDSADMVLSRVEQAFMEISERQHGHVMPWNAAVKQTMGQIETILATRRGLSGLSTGYHNLDKVTHGLRVSEMTILAARPSMGKTALAMNIAENIALGKNDPDQQPRSVGIFSLEMSHEALVMRMLCSHAGVSGFKLASGYISAATDHRKLMQAASVLSKAPIYLDDTGGLDVVELRARARRMKQKHDIQLIIIDYLQLLNSREHARQGRQIETAAISGSLKAMSKELRVPVLVLSQLSRAPEQRDKKGEPKLSDLRDSGAIEQDADVVWMLRRPSKYPESDEHEKENLAIVSVVKHRNGPCGDARLNFEEEYTRFTDLYEGVDGIDEAEKSDDAEQTDIEPSLTE